MPLISIVMPSFNHELYIADAIESVLGQTIEDFEFFIIDDASTDHSLHVIERYARRDERIIPVIHEINLGIAKTVNEGLDRARGKYVAFISSDDVWMPEKLEKQLKILSEDENLVVWSEGFVIDREGKASGETFSQIHHTVEKKKSGYIFEELIQGNFIFGSSVILKNENLDGIRFNEDLRYLNDFQFNVDIARLYKFWYIPVPLALYRIHEKNTITVDREGHYWDYTKLGEYFLTVYGDRIQNSTRVQIFLASLDHLKKIMYRREEKIDEITEYARSLEESIHRKDAEIGDIAAQVNTLTTYARSLEESIHRKDAEIGDIAAQVNTLTTYARSLEESIHRKDAEIGVVTHYARSLEDTARKKDIVIRELNSRFLQATEYSQSLDDQITAMKRSFITWLRMRKQR